jgi:hypothetical protein
MRKFLAVATAILGAMIGALVAPAIANAGTTSPSQLTSEVTSCSSGYHFFQAIDSYHNTTGLCFTLGTSGDEWAYGSICDKSGLSSDFAFGWIETSVNGAAWTKPGYTNNYAGTGKCAKLSFAVNTTSMPKEAMWDRGLSIRVRSGSMTMCCKSSGSTPVDNPAYSSISTINT